MSTKKLNGTTQAQNSVASSAVLDELRAIISEHSPKAIYLGGSERAALQAAAEADGFVSPPTHGEPDIARLEFCGVPIYRVDSEHHIDFSSNDQAH
jgi:hypothetical protein